jgi:hypothetical protein
MSKRSLPLWGQFLAINLFLDYESNYANAQPEYQYRRFVLFVRHTQRILYNQNYGVLKLACTCSWLNFLRMVLQTSTSGEVTFSDEDVS